MFSERKPRVRGCGVFEFRKQRSTGYENFRRRWGFSFFNGHCENRLVPHAWVGYRGVSHLPWRCGPRGPPPLRSRLQHNEPISLFLDCLPSTIATADLRELFGAAGKVVDAYVSRKVRQNKKDIFGFVRFKNVRDVVHAIKKFNGSTVLGSKIRVSMAKFRKGGDPINRYSLKKLVMRERRTYAGIIVEKKRGVAASLDGLRSVVPVQVNEKLDDIPVLAENPEITSVVKNTVSIKDKVEASDISYAAMVVQDLPSLSPPKKAGVEAGVRGNTKTTDEDNKEFAETDEENLEQAHAVLMVTSPKVTLPTTFGSASLKSPVEETLKVAHSAAPATVAADGNKNDSEINSATKKQKRKETSGNLVKGRPCRAGLLKRPMNIREIHNFLGYYGPTKA